VIIKRIDFEVVGTYQLEAPMTIDVLNGSGHGRRTVTTNAFRTHKQSGNRYALAWVATNGEDARGAWKRLPITVEEQLLRALDTAQVMRTDRGSRFR
jgi:hypothetical protein